MSQQQMATGIAPTQAPTTDAVTVVDSEHRIEAVLDLLEDTDCRAILEATSGEALSAAEIQQTCDIPRSTAYRKLEQLTGAGLLAERLRLRRSGKHTREYVRAIEDVVISVGTGEGVELCVSRREPPAARASLNPVAGD